MASNVHYSSTESFWKNRKEHHETMEDGLKVLKTIEGNFERAYDRISKDEYGLMSTAHWESQEAKLDRLFDKNDKMYDYSNKMYDKLDDVDHDFFDNFNDALEELSKLDIKDYTTNNTMNITEKISYTNFETGEKVEHKQKKPSINIDDISKKKDIFNIEEQYKAYLAEAQKDGKKLTKEEKEQLKLSIIARHTTTAFEHDRYSSGFLDGLSKTLDFIPVIGGVKNIIEGCVGYTLDGEKLNMQERVTLVAMGGVSLLIDAITFGAASSALKTAGKAGMELAKAVGKQIAIEAATAITLGWGGEFAAQFATGLGMPPEWTFLVRIGVSIVGGYATSKASKAFSGKNMDDIADDVVKKIDEVEVKFKRNPKHDGPEFNRQLNNQQDGMNQLTVKEYIDNRDNYRINGRSNEGNAIQKTIREDAFAKRVEQLRESGMTKAQAKEEATSWLKTQAALHDPDQIAGGNVKNVSGVGDKNINSSIGSQWKSRIDDLDLSIADAIKGIPVEDWDKIYLNVKLNY